MPEPSKLSKEELITELKKIANENNNIEDFRKAVEKTLPGIAAIITYSQSGPMKMYMGMAMSHWHPGTIQF